MWPPYCCVPAFFERVILALGEVQYRDPALRARVALACNVAVPPDGPNPLALPVADSPEDWGSKAADAAAAFSAVQAILGATRELKLVLRRLDEIPFGMYEDVLLDHGGDGTAVGLGFDFRELCPRRPDETALPTISRHLARLTPIGTERRNEPHVRSTAFRLDYNGDIHVFDDSGEMPLTRVSWPRLVRASRSIGGEFWVVQRA